MSKPCLKYSMLLSLLLLAIVVCASACYDAKYVQGQRTYEAICANCHMDDGSGVEDLYPSMINNPSVHDINNLVCIIRYGKSTESSLIKMPPNPKLKDVDITNICNYILNDLNKQNQEVLMKEVTSILNSCKD